MQTETEEYKLIFAINELICCLIRRQQDSEKKSAASDLALLLKEVILRINTIELSKDNPNLIHHAGQLMKYLKEVPMIEYLPSTVGQLPDEELQEEVALDYENRLTAVFKSLINEESAGEESQKKIMEIRQMIKDEELGEEMYAACRLFLCADNVLDTRENLKKRMLKNGINVTLANKMLNSFYVNVGYLSGKKQLCPCCGVEWSRIHLAKSPVCNHYYQNKERWHEPIVKTFDGNAPVLLLDDELISSIVLPNLGEISLRDQVLASGVAKDVVMYPGHDDYDLKVICKKESYLIDLKDYYRCGDLINHFKLNQYNKRKLIGPNDYGIERTNVFLVVPQHRVAISETNYLKKLKDGLGSLGINTLSENEFIELIKVKNRG